MILSIWRYAHLVLAILSTVFLLILSVTGVILAFDAAKEQLPQLKADNFSTITLAQSIPGLRDIYPEIIELTVDHNEFVSIDALDKEGNNVKAYINPLTGDILGEVKPKSNFIQQVTALHRSLFLKDTGRIIVGIVSFLLLLITISGIALIVKRQQGFRSFFARINRDFFSQYFHVVSGRLLLIPIFILALTGTYLFMTRMNLVNTSTTKIEHPYPDEPITASIESFSIFQATKLSAVEKVEFPFIADDPSEHFVLKLKDRSLTVSQIDGSIVEENRYPYSIVMEKLSLDLHTGRTNIIWAIILGIASFNILAFIYTGFAITFKRTRIKIKNRYKPEQAEIVILAGTENGSTLSFANAIHTQLLALDKRSFLAGMNQYQHFPTARHLLVFTSTYGLGTAPTNASNFENLLQQHTCPGTLQFSVIGFGSTSYADFCAYGEYVDRLLEQKNGAIRLLPLHYINDKSPEEFAEWVRAWSEKSSIALVSSPALYSQKTPRLKKFTIIAKTEIAADNPTFQLTLKPLSQLKFLSGDLLAIYPANDNRERFYSIGKNRNMIQLVVKLYPDGLGSEYLYRLKKGSIIKGRVMDNPHFHFPAKGPVALIANGTGIAPFLGMIQSNKKKIPIHLYAGFRHNNSLAKEYHQFAEEEIAKGRLSVFETAFSRESYSQYVTDLIRRDQSFFIELLHAGGTIMICGSLHMQHDVEQLLDELLMTHCNRSLSFYKNKEQILTDCY